MVTADNLNLDVLELIFFYLSGNDLPSVALVSRSFFAAVIPRLYHTILFRLSHAKRYPRVISPFAAVLAHPALAIHVRRVDIRIIPSQSHPIFLSECTQALDLCRNLVSFKCPVHHALPPFLSSLQGKERLQELRIHANLTTPQAEMLTHIRNLKTLCLDFGSWNVIDVLPRWTPNFCKTLTSLSFFMSNQLNEGVLSSVLQQLPGLTGLHVIRCPQVDHVAVLRLASHTPLLESLSLSTTESSRPLCTPPPTLSHLKHLALDTRYCMIASPAPAVLTSILDYLQTSLVSFVMRLPEVKMTVAHEFIEQLVKLHANTLRHLAFVDCTLGVESVTAICKSCTHLERLELPIPLKDMTGFVFSVARSSALQTLVDTNMHSVHGPHQSLTQDNVRYLMTQCPKLRKVVSDRRVWKGKTDDQGRVQLSFQRFSGNLAGSYWFMSRTAE